MADSRIDELRRRLERDPGSRLFAQLAEEHRKAGDHQEAVRVARAGLAQHPSYPSARLTLGRALLDSGDASTARVELEAALRDAPDNILASRFLGQALEAVGELGPALLQLQKTLKMAPGDRQLESQIGALQARLRTAPAAPIPRAEVPAEDEGGGPLSPTIRILMPRDQTGRAHRPEPPPLPLSAAPVVRAAASVPPPPVPARPPAAEAHAAPEPRPRTAPLFAEPYYESDVAPTQPTAQAPGDALVPEESAEPMLPSEPLRAEETVFEDTTSPAATPLASSTLAELYYRQGLGERAIEVYRQLLVEEPANEKARGRLAQIESEAAPRPEDPRDARRKALERTILGLEALQAALRGR